MTDNLRQHEIDDELLSAYLDGELSAAERAAVERRLAADPAARQLLDELRGASRAMQSLPREVVGRDLSAAIVQRVVGERSSDAVGKPRSPQDSDDGVLPKLTIGRTRRGWVWASVAVAAALLMMFVQHDRRENEDRNNLPAVAQRERLPAELRAANGAAPRERELAEGPVLERGDATFALREETQPPAASALAVGQAPAAPPPEARNHESGQAVAFDREPRNDPMSTQEPLVVVRVLVKREAIEQKKFERLLAAHGITFEPEPNGEQPEIDRRLGQQGIEDLARRRLAQTTAERAPGAAEDREWVLVEAPAGAIASCLKDLHGDEENFLGVAVEDGPATDQVSSSESLAAQKPAADLSQFNRGIVPPRSQRALPSDESYFQHQAEQGGGALAVPGGGVEGSPRDGGLGAGQPSVPHRDLLNMGRARRVTELMVAAEAAKAKSRHAKNALSAEQLESQPGSLVRVPGNVKEPAKAEGEQLKVLFVLSPGDESAASPAAENRPQ